jgi:hypothetical protein
LHLALASQLIAPLARLLAWIGVLLVSPAEKKLNKKNELCRSYVQSATAKFAEKEKKKWRKDRDRSADCKQAKGARGNRKAMWRRASRSSPWMRAGT